MLQNRIDPWGNIIKTPARGAWTGTRGILHDHQQNIIRPFKLKAWLTCLLEFKGRKRKVMSPDRYTELFFLDEATAFAAGHRPCCECRRKNFNHFKTAWLNGNPGYGFNEKTSINEIDKILHSERLQHDGKRILYEDAVENIPAGTFVVVDDKAFLVVGDAMFEWSPFGYSNEKSLAGIKKLTVLTPLSIVNTFRAGYAPQIKQVPFV